MKKLHLTTGDIEQKHSRVLLNRVSNIIAFTNTEILGRFRELRQIPTDKPTFSFTSVVIYDESDFAWVGVEGELSVELLLPLTELPMDERLSHESKSSDLHDSGMLCENNRVRPGRFRGGGGSTFLFADFGRPFKESFEVRASTLLDSRERTKLLEIVVFGAVRFVGFGGATGNLEVEPGRPQAVFDCREPDGGVENDVSLEVGCSIVTDLLSDDKVFDKTRVVTTVEDCLVLFFRVVVKGEAPIFCATHF